MDVGFHHCRIDAHASTRHNSLFESDFNDPLMNLLEYLRPHRHAPTPHGLGVRHLAAAYPCEVAVDEVGAHFTFEYCVAPVADMLENQQSQDHFSWRTTSATTATLGMSFAQRLIHGRKDRLVVQDRVGVLHPILAQVIDFLSDPMIAKLQLRASHINHGASSRAWATPDPGATVRD